MENLLDLKKEDIEKLNVETLKGLQFILKTIIRTSKEDYEKAIKLNQLIKEKLETHNEF